MLGTFTYIMLLIFTMILMGRYYRHFMAKETETQSREVTCSGNTSSKNRVGIQRQLCWIPKPVFFILCSNSDMPTLAESKHTVFINIFQNYIFIFKPIGVSSCLQESLPREHVSSSADLSVVVRLRRLTIVYPTAGSLLHPL